MADRERPLPGGFVTRPVQVGATVRRAPSSDFAVRVLDHFAARGWPGAPRFLGTDELGRHVLSYLDGHVAWERTQPPAVTAPARLARVAELVREFHDLTAGTPLAAGGEVVCHNDLSPKNTVYGDDLRRSRSWTGTARRPASGSTTSPTSAGSTWTSGRAARTSARPGARCG